jgi:hypothetical protein
VVRWKHGPNDLGRINATVLIAKREIHARDSYDRGLARLDDAIGDVALKLGAYRVLLNASAIPNGQDDSGRLCRVRTPNRARPVRYPA